MCIHIAWLWYELDHYGKRGELRSYAPCGLFPCSVKTLNSSHVHARWKPFWFFRKEMFLNGQGASSNEIMRAVSPFSTILTYWIGVFIHSFYLSGDRSSFFFSSSIEDRGFLPSVILVAWDQLEKYGETLSCFTETFNTFMNVVIPLVQLHSMWNQQKSSLINVVGQIYYD